MLINWLYFHYLNRYSSTLISITSDNNASVADKRACNIAIMGGIGEAIAATAIKFDAD